MLVVSANDSSYQRMTDDVAFLQETEFYAFHALQHADSILQTGHLSARKVDLCQVAGDDPITA